MKITINQKKVLEALRNPKNFKPSMKKIKEETRLKHNKSVIRAYEALHQKGLIDDEYKPILKRVDLKTDSTTTQGVKPNP